MKDLLATVVHLEYTLLQQADYVVQPLVASATSTLFGRVFLPIGASRRTLGELLIGDLGRLRAFLDELLHCNITPFLRKTVYLAVENVK